MGKEQNIEKIYELIEQFDFNELSADDKLFILEYISIEEYNKMRSAITDTKDLFNKYPESISKKKPGNLKKLLTYQIEFYKIAASIILLIGIGFMFSKGSSSVNQGISKVDKVIVQNTDTVFSVIRDTVEIIREKIVYKDLQLIQNSKSLYYGIMESVNYKIDCAREICPEDLGRLSQIKTEGNLSRDTALMKFVVSLN